RINYTKRAQKFARGGGYQSQIGRGTSRDSGASASMAGTHDSLIPPLAIEYKAVERTPDADFGTIALKLHDEATTRVEETSRKAGNKYMRLLASNKRTPQAQRALREQLTNLEKDISLNMDAGPLHYANSKNRSDLAAKAANIVSLENLAKADKQMDD